MSSHCEGDQLQQCIVKLYVTFQQLADIRKAVDSVAGESSNTASTTSDRATGPSFNTSVCSNQSRSSTPCRKLRTEDWIPNVLQHAPEVTVADCSSTTLDALDLCSPITTAFMQHNLQSQLGSPELGEPITMLRSSSPVTVSSGYYSDNVECTREDEIDTLWQSMDRADIHQPSERYAKVHTVSHKPHDKDRRPSKRLSEPCPSRNVYVNSPSFDPQSPVTPGKRNRDANIVNLQQSPCLRNSVSPVFTSPNKIAFSDSNNRSTDTYLEPLGQSPGPQHFVPLPARSSPVCRTDLKSERLNRSCHMDSFHSGHSDSFRSGQCDSFRSEGSNDEALGSASDSSLDCTVAWDWADRSVSVDSGRSSWCSQNSVRCPRDLFDERNYVSGSCENIYETIDDIPDTLSETSLHTDCTDHTYDVIKDDCLSPELPSPVPPELPKRNIRHPLTTLSQYSNDYVTAKHIDDIVKHSDIVDMNSYHMYTVRDVLDSVDRYAGHLMEHSKPAIPTTGAQHDQLRSTSLKELPECDRRRSSSFLKPKKSKIEYFRCGKDIRPTPVRERFQTDSEECQYTAQWHAGISGVPPTYC